MSKEPEQMVMVPREPTHHMLAAGCDAIDAEYYAPTFMDIERVWDAMIKRHSASAK